MSFKPAKWDSDGLGNTYDELFKNKITTKKIKSKIKKSKHLKLSESPLRRQEKIVKTNSKSINTKLNGKFDKDEILTKSKRKKLKKLRKKQEQNNENIRIIKNSPSKIKIDDGNTSMKETNNNKTNKERKVKTKKQHGKIKNERIKSESLKTDESKKKKKSRSLKKRLEASIQQENLMDQVEINKKILKKRQNKNFLIQSLNSTKNDLPVNKANKKKKFFEKLSQALTKPPSDKKPVLTLRQRMLEHLKGSRFRFLNEKIYTTDSKSAQNIFKSDPEAFQAYHEGYRKQVERWPLNPVDEIIKSVKKIPKTHVIADFGCGDAKLSKSVPQKVFSFDLVAVDETVIACDMSKVPLDDGTVDVAVFCLSLMGTNLHDYLLEANRVLKIGGVLKIAEVESRFENVSVFIKGVQHFGFKNTWKDLSHNLFYFMDFRKESNVKNRKKVPTVSLLPCLYKKR